MAPLAALLVLMAAAVAARASSAASAVAGPSLLELVTDVHARRAPVDFQSPDLRRLGRLRTRPPSLLVAPEASDGFRYASVNAPPSWDWRLAPTRALTAVKSQEAGCADCWAVVTADAVSSARAIAEAREVDDVSPESLHVCQGRECCTGGWPELALEAITTANTTSQLAAWEITPARNALALMQAIFVQPVIAYVSSSNPAFASYTGGILSTSDCPAGELDHALLVVGYAADVTEPYWVVKNSWGPEWGEAGYAKLAMTDGDGTCGMLSMPALMPIHLPARGSCLSANKLCGGGSCITLESQEAYTCNCPLGFVLDATNAAAPKCVPTKSDVQALDAPSSADGPVTENVIEHVIREGETLDSIAQLLVQLCGPVASPENILFFNDGAPYSTGMTLRLPCRRAMGRYCGCTPDSPVCGWTSKLYSSLCDAICNYDTPTRQPDSNGQCDPCEAACGGRCWGNMKQPYPAYCDNVNHYTPCPFPPFPPITSSCTDYLQECQNCCWGLSYGSYSYNQCFANCRSGKC